MPENMNITDPHVIARVEKVREKNGVRTCTAMATTLLIQYLTILDERERADRLAQLPEPVTA